METFGDVAAGSLWARFWSGAAFAASGIGFTLRHTRLLAWAAVPMLIQALIFVALVIAGSAFIDDVVLRFGPEPGNWYSFIGAVLGVALWVLLVVSSVIASIFLGGVVCDPFYDVLSEATETVLLGRSVAEPFSLVSVVKGIIAELFASLWRLAIFAAVALPLWLIGLTGVGSVVAVPLSLAWSFLFVALAGLSRSMSRHAIPGKRRVSVMFSQTAASLGFGAVGWLLAYIPLTTPFLVVGGTRLYLALAAWDRVDSNLTAADRRTLQKAA